MATRRKGTVHLESDGDGYAVPASLDDGAASGDDVALDEDGTQSPIERVMVALAESADPQREARVSLYRIIPGPPGKPAREEWCVDMEPAEFEAGGLSAVRDTWGPGTYEARLLGYKRGSTYFTRLQAPRFTIAPLPAGAQALAVAAPRNDALAALAPALQALADGQARMLDALTQRAPAPDPMEQMRGMLTLMSTMREAMGLNVPPAPAPERSSIREIVDAIQEIKGVAELVSPPDKSEKSDMERMLEMVTPVIGMVQQSMQAPASQPAPLLQVPPALKDSYAPGAAVSTPSNTPVSSPVVSGAAGAAPDAASSAAPAEAVQDQEKILAELRACLAELLTMAAASASFEDGARLVYDKLPDDWVELLHMPIWWQAFSTAAPEVVPHEKWLHAVRDRVVQMFAEGE